MNDNNIHKQILSLSKPINQEYPYKDEVKAIKKSDDIA